jgi:hypothetical protein
MITTLLTKTEDNNNFRDEQNTLLLNKNKDKKK